MAFFGKCKFIILRELGGGIETGRVWGGGFWDASDILFLDLHGSYMSVYFM